MEAYVSQVPLNQHKKKNISKMPVTQKAKHLLQYRMLYSFSRFSFRAFRHASNLNNNNKKKKWKCKTKEKGGVHICPNLY